MTTTHTPGPWEASGGVVTAKSRTVQVALTYSGNVNYRPSAEAMDANARLIAAAPDLLAALKDMLPMWESGIQEPWVKAARAAIAKAEG